MLTNNLQGVFTFKFKIRIWKYIIGWRYVLFSGDISVQALRHFRLLPCKGPSLVIESSLWTSGTLSAWAWALSALAYCWSWAHWWPRWRRGPWPRLRQHLRCRQKDWGIWGRTVSTSYQTSGPSSGKDSGQMAGVFARWSQERLINYGYFPASEGSLQLLASWRLKSWSNNWLIISWQLRAPKACCLSVWIVVTTLRPMGRTTTRWRRCFFWCVGALRFPASPSLTRPLQQSWSCRTWTLLSRLCRLWVDVSGLGTASTWCFIVASVVGINSWLLLHVEQSRFESSLKITFDS